MLDLFQPPLRPPGAVSEKHFASLCIRCGKCVVACPRGSIRLAGGFGKNRLTPCIEAEKSPCDLCMKCPPACPTGALDKTCVDHEAVKMGQAHILRDKCHNFTDGIMCMTCYDRCPIRGRGIVLDMGITPAMTSLCAGCGVCVYVCPVDAIVVTPKDYAFVPETALPMASQP